MFWGGWGLALRGCVLTLTGEAEEAAENIASGIAAIRSTGNTMWTPPFLSYLAWANGKTRQTMSEASDEQNRDDNCGHNSLPTPTTSQ